MGYLARTKSGKHCRKRRNCSFWAISFFVNMFSKCRPLQSCQKAYIWGKLLTKGVNGIYTDLHIPVVLKSRPRGRGFDLQSGNTKFLQNGSNGSVLGVQDCGLALRLTGWCQDKWTRKTCTLPRKRRDITENPCKSTRFSPQTVTHFIRVLQVGHRLSLKRATS